MRAWQLWRLAARRGVQLIVVGIENGRGKRRAALRQRDGNAEAGIVMGEIRGAVERVDVPAKFGSGVLAGALFRGDGVAGEKFVDAGNNILLGALVRLRDEVDFVALVANVQRPGELLDKDLSRFLSNLHRRLQIIFPHQLASRKRVAK